MTAELHGGDSIPAVREVFMTNKLNYRPCPDCRGTGKRQHSSPRTTRFSVTVPHALVRAALQNR